MAERNTIKKISLKTPEQEEPKENLPHKTVRHAVLEDIPRLLELTQQLQMDSPMEMIGVDFERTQEQMEAAIMNDMTQWLGLVSYDGDEIVGTLFAYAFQPIFSKHKVAVEVLMYLDPAHRKGRRGLDMMNAYEYWAKMIGCKVAQYGWLASSPKSMETLYEKRGAVLAEKVYYKEL